MMTQHSDDLSLDTAVVALVVLHSVMCVCVCVSGLDDDGDLKGNYFGTLYTF